MAALERAFRRQRRKASAGVDGVTVAAYEQDLEANRLGSITEAECVAMVDAGDEDA